MPLDHQKAFSWFNQAAKKGLKESQFNVAIALQGGLGARKDMIVSYKFYILSAAQGMRDAATARDHLAQYLSRDQIETGQRMARGFMLELERRQNLAKRRESEKRRMNAIKNVLNILKPIQMLHAYYTLNASPVKQCESCIHQIWRMIRVHFQPVFN